MIKLDIIRQNKGKLMTFLEAVIIRALEMIKAERTIYSVYHLLKGKKSSQTIQDAHLFKLDKLFQTYPQLTRAQFENIIQSLQDRSFLVCEDLKGAVTEKGHENAEEILRKSPVLKDLDGLKLQDTANIFWRRLSLTVQVVSNLIYNEKHYYPIQRDPLLLRWMKSYLHKYPYGKEEIGEKIHKEIYGFLSNNPPEKAEILVIRLTGYRHIGKTIEQAAESLRMEKTEYWFRFLRIIHCFIRDIVKKKEMYPFLYTLVSDAYKQTPLTKSALRTYELLNHHYSLNDIAVMRNLKTSTIEDHIIEIALSDPDFTTSPFLDQKTEQRILREAKVNGHRKLKPIKESVGNVSYFQIRLALAKRRD